MIDSQEEAIEILYRAMPYSNQITNLNLTKNKGAVYFKWRGENFRLELGSGRIDEVGDGVLIGNNIAMLATELIKREWQTK